MERLTWPLRIHKKTAIVRYITIGFVFSGEDQASQDTKMTAYRVLYTPVHLISISYVSSLPSPEGELYFCIWLYSTFESVELWVHSALSV